MSIEYKAVINQLYSIFEHPLKDVEPDMTHLEIIPTNISQLPGIYLELRKITLKNSGIGNFIGSHISSAVETGPEISGQKYEIWAMLEIWVNNSDTNSAIQNISLLTVKAIEIILNETIEFRKKGINSLEIIDTNAIESGSLNGLIPQMADTIKKTINLKFSYETIKAELFNLIKDIDVNISTQ